MKLWGGRFTKEEDQAVHAFNESLSFDRRLYRQDITGSIAHAKMLAKQGIVTAEDRDAIVAGLEGILKEIEDGTDRRGRKASSHGAQPQRPGGSGYEALLPGAGRRDQRTGEGAGAGPSPHHGREPGDLHAGLHPSAEGPAGDACPSYGGVF